MVELNILAAGVAMWFLLIPVEYLSLRYLHERSRCIVEAVTTTGMLALIPTGLVVTVCQALRMLEVGR